MAPGAAGQHPAARGALQQALLQQRARIVELLEDTTACLNQLQGRIAELTELLARPDTTDGDQ